MRMAEPDDPNLAGSHPTLLQNGLQSAAAALARISSYVLPETQASPFPPPQRSATTCVHRWESSRGAARVTAEEGEQDVDERNTTNDDGSDDNHEGGTDLNESEEREHCEAPQMPPSCPGNAVDHAPLPPVVVGSSSREQLGGTAGIEALTKSLAAMCTVIDERDEEIRYLQETHRRDRAECRRLRSELNLAHAERSEHMMDVAMAASTQAIGMMQQQQQMQQEQQEQQGQEGDACKQEAATRQALETDVLQLADMVPASSQSMEINELRSRRAELVAELAALDQRIESLAWGAPNPIASASASESSSALWPW